MSAASKTLSELLRIHSPHNASSFAKKRGGVGVYLSYRPASNGRAWQSAAWQVIRPGYETDPDAHWRDYGHKTFHVFSRDRDEQEQAAKDWAEQRYDITGWAKISGLRGCWFPQQDADLIKAALREAKKTATETEPES